MILFDKGQNRPVIGGQVPARPTPKLAPPAPPAEAASGSEEHGEDEQLSARQEVEAWLDAVALCFGLHDRRWIDFQL